MSDPLPPPPVRENMYDDAGVMTQRWARWLTAVHTQIQNVNTSNPAYDYIKPVDGFKYGFNGTVQTLIVDGSGTLNTGSATTPPNPVDGQIVRISAGVNVTAFSLLPSGTQAVKGGPNGLVAGLVYAYTFAQDQNTWFPT